MKKYLQNLAILGILSVLIISGSSCKKEDDNEKAANDLHGTWTINQTNVDLTVDGVDLVDYMVSNFTYTQQQAQAMVDIFTVSLQSGNSGTITFREDNTYTFVNNDEEENGTWSIGNDGATLTMNFDNEADNLTILSLSSSSLKLQIPTESEMADLDGNGEDETEIDIDTELTMSK